MGTLGAFPGGGGGVWRVSPRFSLFLFVSPAFLMILHSRRNRECDLLCGKVGTIAGVRAGDDR